MNPFGFLMDDPPMQYGTGGQLQPYQPGPSATDALQGLYGMTGIPDIIAAYQAAQRGEVMPALGQAGFAAAGMLPFGAMAKAVRPTAEALSALPKVMHDGRAFTDYSSVAKFPQYADAYPVAGPPKWKLGDNPMPEEGEIGPGRMVAFKNLTPEAKAFQKERVRIQNDMDANGYEPYYPPEQRYYVDPSNYPPRTVDTSTLMPKTEKTLKEYMDAIGPLAPETTARLQAAYDKGLKLGDSQHWYAMGQLENDYVNRLGPEAGRKAFADEFAAPMAATTSGNSPNPNLMFAHYLEFMRKNGLEVPEEAHQLPYPVGGRRGNENLANYAAMRATGLGENTPKMLDFFRSFLGDLSRPVIDEQMANGLVPNAGWANKGRTGAYGLMQQPVHWLARQLGIEPGNVQDVAWAGFKNAEGKSMISEYNEAIERTHRLTGRPRDEIAEKFIRKQIPMYGAAGAVPLGGLLGQSDADWY